VILVDTSVWVDYLRGAGTPQAARLDGLIGVEPLLVGDLILCEVLQGVPTERQARGIEAALRRFEVVPLVGERVALRAAANFRALRSLGVTVRRTIDLLIGTYCVEHGHALLHSDREFDAMERHLGLSVLR
jgi:predicted nucleic acid-binding protein